MNEQDGFIDFSKGVGAVDPAVEALLRGGKQRRAEQRLSPKARRKRIKEREKARARNRVLLDLDPKIEKRIKALAKGHRCPISQVAALALVYGLAAIQRGDIDVDAYKETSLSPRFDWNLRFEVEEFGNIGP